VLSSLNVEQIAEKAEKDFWTIGQEAVEPFKKQFLIQGRRLRVNPIFTDWYGVDFPVKLESYIAMFSQELISGKKIFTSSYNWKLNKISEAVVIENELLVYDENIDALIELVR